MADPRPAFESRRVSIEQALLELVSQIANELHPMRASMTVALTSSLQNDLGIDSLGRSELGARIEKEFGVHLSDQVIATAETPADLLDELIETQLEVPGPTRSPTRMARAAAPVEHPRTGALPTHARTLLDVLSWQAERNTDERFIELFEFDPEERSQTLTYRELLSDSTTLASSLLRAGLTRGSPVAIMLPTSTDFFFSFFGVLLAGGVPVPLYPPDRPSQIEDYLRRQRSILTNCAAQILITTAEGRALAPLLKRRSVHLEQVTTPAELLAVPAEADAPTLPPNRGGDLAFLQYTSGSTGDPKGVALTHENLLTNIRAMGSAIQAGPRDVFVSWLPLYHDMGLIGACLGTLYHAIPLVLMSPLSFLARPSRWLRLIDRFRGTLIAGPNFAYEICARRIPAEQIEGLDLSSVRVAFNGAEAVSAGTLERFTERFRPHGFHPEALTPVYGLAENAVGLTFPPLGRGPRIDRIDRSSLLNDSRAIPWKPQLGGHEYKAVSCGLPLAGHELRVIDSRDRSLPEREVGRVWFRGPSATRGYYRMLSWVDWRSFAVWVAEAAGSAKSRVTRSRSVSSPTIWLA